MPSDTAFLPPLDDGFRLGEWTVLPRSLELSRPERVVHVEPKPMQVLTLLAARAGEAVTREELLDAVWPEVYVTENAVSRCVSQLRKLLDDDPRTPRVIETIPTVGYRLIAPVYHLGDGQDGAARPAEASDVAVAVAGAAPLEGEAAAVATPADARRDARFGLQMGAAWGALALAVVVLALIAAFGREAEPDRVTRPLTSMPGRETGPALSPDGSRVLYVYTNEGDSDLFVGVVGQAAPLQLTSGPAVDLSAAWAPDGRTVAFVRCEEGACGLYEVSALGGEARRLAEGSAVPGGLSFAPDGRTLAFAARDSAGTPAKLYLLDLATGERRPLTNPPAASDGDIGPVFAPAGTSLVFRRRTGGGGEDLYRLALPGGTPERLTGDGRSIAGYAFSRDGRDVVYSSNRTGMYELWRIPATGGTPERVRGVAARDPGGPEVGDGMLVFEEWAFEINLWEVAADSAEGHSLVVSTWWDKHPHLRPDGERIAFISNRSGPPEVWVVGRDGSSPTRLTDFGGASVEAPRWSPSGDRIVFQARPETSANLYVVGPQGGPPRPLTTDGADNVAPRWSRDGAWIYFGSNRDGSWQLWKMPVAGGEAVRVTDAGGYTGEESTDGADVLYTKLGEAGLWARPIGGGRERLVTDDLSPAVGMSWAVTDAGVLFPQRVGDASHLARLDPATGTVGTWPLQRGDLMPHEPGLTATADGSRVVLAQVDRVESDLMLVEPFE
jgi:Tol biopolymer transport system component/DNA-binding winged helix-turn-helix (wHTH) protein